jgi:hypothetical protein
MRPLASDTQMGSKAVVGSSSLILSLQGRHVRSALGRKPSDEFAVPLCRSHHRAGDERAWWQANGIDPVKVARKLWKHTRMNEGLLRSDEKAQDADVDRPTKMSDESIITSA